MSGAIAGVLITCGILTVAPVHGQLRDGGLLPQEESGLITVLGCFVRGGDDGDGFVLAHPKRGPVESVEQEACTARTGDNALDLDDTDKLGMNESLTGRWIEVSGNLEKETSDDPDNLRELEVRSFRIVPVVPRIAEAPPAPIPEPQVAAAEPVIEQPAPEPVGTSGQAETTLPQTASYLPTTGFAGLLLLAGGLVLRTWRLKQG
jgi:hypothetical protein